MINKGYRLALAKLLKLYKEISTDNATLVAEADEITVGTEVFVETEEGMTPAPDGEYSSTTDNLIYVVVGGTITEIKEKETSTEEGSDNGASTETEENMEDNGENGSDNGSDTGASAEGEDPTKALENKVNELETALEEANNKIAELEAKVAEQETVIAEYKAKEEETAPSADETEKFNKQTGNKALDKKLQAAKVIMGLGK